MSILRTVQRMIDPLRNRIAGMVARAAVLTSDDSKRMQELQLELYPGEVISGAERVQNYGFTSRPKDPTGDQSAEAAVVFAGGGRDHPLVVSVDDRRYRLVALAKGEAAMYDDLGNKVHLQRDQLLIKGVTKVRLEVGASSIVIETDKITLTSADFDFNKT